MHKSISIRLLIGVTLFIAGFGGNAAKAQSSSDLPQGLSSASTTVVTDSLTYTLQSTRRLDADGVDSGLSAYDLIRAFGGRNPIESPDLYPLNHPEVEHIVEGFDDVIGNHFIFKSHRDIDRDRDRYATTDRQRNEIKTYNSSEEAVKGYENETMIFTWKFKIDAGMEVSKKFSHFFQLKAVGGPDGQPIVSFTGNERSGEDGIEVRHIDERAGSVLARADWSEVTGEWVEAYVRATFADEGDLRIILTRLTDGEVILDIDETNLDMWRGTDSEHIVRPKWGIYRSLDDSDNLRPEEEIVRFANFEVQKVLVDQQ